MMAIGAGAALVLLAFFDLTCAAVVDINLKSILHTVDDSFVSFTMDQELLGISPKWNTFDFHSPKLHTLLRGLSPAFLRFGGSPADYSMFTQADPAFLKTLSSLPIYQSYSKTDIDDLVGITSNCSLRLLFELNLQLREGDQWDPTNAIALLDYFHSKGYGKNVDFELGNEPNVYGSKNLVALSGTQIGKDYQMLRKVMNQYAEVKGNIMVGPDIVGEGSHEMTMMNDFVKEAANNITAVTFHHYYFHGPDATVQNYIDPKNFRNLEDNINLVRKVIGNVTTPDKPLWIGETSDSWGSGTPNVSDRYASGFLWLDKLGLSAKMNIGVVMRQTFYGYAYSLIRTDFSPTPDYWLSYAHKQLVGSQVLGVDVQPDTLYWPSSPLLQDFAENIRVYSHCTKPSNRYRAGAVTMFAINMKNTTYETFMFKGDLAFQKVDVYLLTPGDADGLLSMYVNCNGKRIEMVSDTELPALIPSEQEASIGVSLLPLTFGFFVFPDADATACK